MFTSSVLRSVAQRARAGYRDRPAVSLEDGPTWTYGELVANVNRYANGLLDLGVTAGDRVGLLMRNSLEYWAAYLATTRIGAIAVRLNWRLAPAELDYALRDSGATVLCLDDAFTGELRQMLGVLPDLTPVAFTEGADPFATQPATEPPVDDPAATDPCMIMYTSGTTGRPKGALWSHDTTLWQCAIQVMQWKYDKNLVCLSTTPMYHVSAVEDWALPALMLGGHAVMMRSTGLRPERIAAMVRRHGVTDTFLVPSVIYDLLTSDAPGALDLPSLRRVVTGGSPMAAWAVTKMRQALPDVSLEQAYGLTEGGPISTVMDPADLDTHPASVGTPMPLVEVRIARLDDLAADAAADQEGEIWVRGPATCGVYYNKPEATAATFVDGWCRTGDLGRLTADGHLYVVGRVKDMIISGGENIYPAQVEAVLLDHPAVKDAAVIGIPDARWGERPCAVIVTSPGMTVTADELVARCRGQLAGYECPRHVVLVDELPRNASGKVLKRVLRDQYASLGTRGRGMDPNTAS
ncbi:MAG: AMP-binding protein [Streptosporangiales bacterium]|nr:AMP-binding protein [Streptosporangiales bacterium]